MNGSANFTGVYACVDILVFNYAPFLAFQVPLSVIYVTFPSAGLNTTFGQGLKASDVTLLLGSVSFGMSLTTDFFCICSPDVFGNLLAPAAAYMQEQIYHLQVPWNGRRRSWPSWAIFTGVCAAEECANWHPPPVPVTTAVPWKTCSRSRLT